MTLYRIVNIVHIFSHVEFLHKPGCPKYFNNNIFTIYGNNICMAFCLILYTSLLQ